MPMLWLWSWRLGLGVAAAAVVMGTMWLLLEFCLPMPLWLLWPWSWLSWQWLLFKVVPPLLFCSSLTYFQENMNGKLPFSFKFQMEFILKFQFFLSVPPPSIWSSLFSTSSKKCSCGPITIPDWHSLIHLADGDAAHEEVKSGGQIPEADFGPSSKLDDDKESQETQDSQTSHSPPA